MGMPPAELLKPGLHTDKYFESNAEETYYWLMDTNPDPNNDQQYMSEPTTVLRMLNTWRPHCRFSTRELNAFVALIESMLYYEGRIGVDNAMGDEFFFSEKSRLEQGGDYTCKTM